MLFTDIHPSFYNSIAGQILYNQSKYLECQYNHAKVIIQ